ncbi:VCBS domain-containing protein [Vibrio japonicus]|uniref:VCBS domain-containing protein n=1 Tax=Vibrio japonicus TaxID=1824638 RepID=A0ABY5LKE0_9VIBR|nr:VCBS domain-containing protein [Vibrio japonicus]UUM31886.1 VCBS domain-containing protein [Vibrio japonicus]
MRGHLASTAGASRVRRASGTFRVDANGKWTYVLDNGNETVDALNVDETLTETFTVKSEDGTEQVVTITIHGANDGAKITGDDSGS